MKRMKKTHEIEPWYVTPKEDEQLERAAWLYRHTDFEYEAQSTPDAFDVIMGKRRG